MLKIDPQKLKWLHARMILVGILFACGFVGLVRRAWRLQIEQQGKFRAMAEEQYLKDVELPPRRGAVYDRTGARLATSADVDSIYANPRMIGDEAPEVAARLAPIVKVEKAELAKRLASGRYFAWIARRVSPDTAAAVQKLGIDGIFLTKEPKRYYPAPLAGPMLGFADADAHGIEGIELSLDKELRGERLAAPALRDALGREVMSAGLPDIGATGGGDVQLTIDRYIQFAAERALAAAIEKSRAKDGSVTVIDPRTGEILAMASWPTYDPNDPRDIAKKGARNRPVTDAYEPGSTMKTFSVAAALENGATRPTDSWDCMNGKMKVGGFTIHDTHPHGILTTAEVIAKSSNIGAARIAKKLGREKLYDFLRGLGFAHSTAIELPGEGAGRLKRPERWGDTDVATIAFGQSITATPVQLLQGLTAIADGGIQHPPRIVKKVVDHEGKVTSEWKLESKRVMTEKTAHQMVEMLKLVTEKGGTAEGVVLSGYKIAGKTGTAQKVDPATRRYSAEKWVSSFMGFVPADSPRLAMIVVIDEPYGSHYGSVVAAPVFRDIAEQALKYLGVPPRAEDMVVAKKTDEPAPKSRKVPPAVEQIAVVEDEGGDTAVPDFTGMSIGEAVSAARRAHLEIDVRGSGRAIAQEPGPGAAPTGAVCRVEFQPPS